MLMIFVKNPRLGKVKTRLAKTIGNKKALEVYKELLSYTYYITKFIDFDKAVFYSENIIDNDLWNTGAFQKYVQVGGNLGAKMSNAFESVFSKGYEKVVIIGSDCFQLTAEIIERSFDLLDSNDAVIGPAKDGGYYLLGINSGVSEYKELFRNKIWSSNKVLPDTLTDLKKINNSYMLLETLSDVDYEEDLSV